MMHTVIAKHRPRSNQEIEVANEDGMVWEPVWPEGSDQKELAGKKYLASIPDKRLFHFSFSCTGYHTAAADTIDELIDDIRALNVPYYSSSRFLDELRRKDTEDTRDDRQVELYCDGRGTSVKRGKLSINNMTAYTSF